MHVSTQLYLFTVSGQSKLQALQKNVEANELTLESLRKGVAAGVNMETEVVEGQHKLILIERSWRKQSMGTFLLNFV